MPKKSNIAGVRFGSLVAVEPTDNRQNGYTIWRCLCDCGRLAFVSSRHLKNGWMTSCGDQACSHQQKSITLVPGTMNEKCLVYEQNMNIN